MLFHKETRARCATALGVLCIAYFGPIPIRYAVASETMQKVPILVYENPQRTERYEFRGRGAYLVYVDPKSFLPGQISESKEIEIGGNVSTADCSTAHLSCALFSPISVAVPRDTLRDDAEYTAGGSSLKVYKCYRGAAGSCQVALIESKCFYDGKACATNSESGDSIFVLAFIYNVDFGVTSFGFLHFGQSEPHNEQEMFSLATQYTLLGSVGMLRK